jgi:hypothetical protein
MRCRIPASFRLRCSTASNSEEYEVESSTDSQTLEPARTGPTYVVPESSSPLRSTSFPSRHRGFRPRFSPRTLESSASERALLHANRDASNRRPRVFDRLGNQRIYERPAAPLGFLLHPEDALAPPGALLRQAPACPSEPKVLRGF